MATQRHTPKGRGYESFLGYFHHSNDYFNATVSLACIGEINVCDNKYVDLWKNDGPALGLNSTLWVTERVCL